MKSKILLTAIAILILACSITAISAEKTTYDGHSFEIPKGYKNLNSTDEQLILTNNENHVLVIMFSDKVSDNDDVKSNLEKKGYKFLGQESYDASNYKINQQNYETDKFTVLSYDFKVKNGDYCIITYTMPKSVTPPEGSANPVTEILETVE